MSQSERFLPGSRSFNVGRLGLAIVLLLAYVVVLIGYAQSTVGAGISQVPAPPTNGVALYFAPSSVDPNVPSMTGLMYVLPGPDLVDESGRLKQDLAIDAYPVLGPGSVTFEAGQTPMPMNLAVSAEGNVRDYPFDTYEAVIVSTVSTRPSAGAPWTRVPVAVGAQGELGGWVLSFEAPSSTRLGGEEVKTADGYGIQVMGARRAVSTIAVALLLLLLMVLLAVMAALVARAAALRLRRVEPSLAGWMGAMLFALIPLRNFLPGAPPLGSWIDVLVFFWVEIVIMVALAVYVAAWLRDGPPSDRQGS